MVSMTPVISGAGVELREENRRSFWSALSLEPARLGLRRLDLVLLLAFDALVADVDLGLHT